METYSGTGLNPSTDYLYVATASDFGGLQGFLAEFQNTTQNLSIKTGDGSWDVFPAGQYLQQINSNWPAAWPYLTMPTQAEVGQAIAYASANNLWVNPSTGPGYTNVSSNNPWGRTFSSIPTNTDFIWHDTGRDNSSIAPFDGFNHDEFLVFRVAPVPEPSAGLLDLVSAMSLCLIRRSGS